MGSPDKPSNDILERIRYVIPRFMRGIHAGRLQSENRFQRGFAVKSSNDKARGHSPNPLMVNAKLFLIAAYAHLAFMFGSPWCPGLSHPLF